jgi:threonine/homoserine/homoserine lactone efflux protein
MSDLAHPAAAFGLGIALGTSPGPVQLLLFSEASRGGAGRGLRAMAGANGTFGTMLLVLALGVSSLRPGAGFVRVIQVIGGSFLLFLAVDALRESHTRDATEGKRSEPHPTIRGAIAVVGNPGVYVFLATTGTAVLADATDAGGRSIALLTALALLAGVSVMDSGMVVLGASARRVSRRSLRILGDGLAVGFGVIGAWLVIRGIAG